MGRKRQEDKTKKEQNKNMKIKQNIYQQSRDSQDEDREEDYESDVFARVFWFSLTKEGSTEGTAVGEPPEAGEASDQQGDDPGSYQAAGDCKAPTPGFDLTGNI